MTDAAGAESAPPPSHTPGFFQPVADFLGEAYWAPNTTRIQSFTVGTEQEVDFLARALELAPGARVLDAGCGPGRHSLALARRAYRVTGVDASPTFIELAREAAVSLDVNAEFVVGDVRELGREGEFDAVLCLCQGGFGLLGGGDDESRALRSLGAALRPGGRLALSAFSAYFVLRYLEAHDNFDADTGVNHERAELRNERGDTETFDLWTTCFTPRELRLLAREAGLVVDEIASVTPAGYAHARPTIDSAEFLLLAHRAD